MLENYLPKLATLSEACDWLKSEIGEMFTISRLIENGLMPWFWLDYSEQSSTLFDGRKEGYLAPIVFNGDTQRLSADKGDALVNWTRAFNGELREIIPPMRVALGDLRFKHDDLKELASIYKDATNTPTNGESKTDLNTKEMWVAEARKLGQHYIEEWRKAGYEPTIANIGLYVEGVFSTNGTYNTSGNIIDRATIVREALTGITGNKVGHKSKKLKIPDGKAGQLPKKQ